MRRPEQLELALRLPEPSGRRGALRIAILLGIDPDDPCHVQKAQVVNALTDLRHLCQWLELAYQHCDRSAHDLYLADCTQLRT